MTPLPGWTFAGFAVKPYWISAHAVLETPGSALIEASAGCVAGALRDVERQAQHYGLGFVILHHGEDGIWLLFYWWAYRSIICTQRWRSEDTGPYAFAPLVDRLTNACVWESVIVEYERRAWVSCLMSGRPDANAYLDDLLSPGRY